MKTLSKAEREARDARILALVREGRSERQVAAEIGCSRTTVFDVKQKAAGR